MKPALFASLVAHIEAWGNENCEEAHWVDGYVHEKYAEQMASAAAAVMDAMEGVQEFMRREGHSE
jgi:hypothetical protein